MSGPTTIVPDLVIDTVGPKVTGVAFNRTLGQIIVTFQDYGGPNNTGVGLNAATLLDASNYQLTTVHHPRVGKYLVSKISAKPATTTGTQTVTLDNQQREIHQDRLVLLHDLLTEPNRLGRSARHRRQCADGEFYGTYPSGNNQPAAISSPRSRPSITRRSRCRRSWGEPALVRQRLPSPRSARPKDKRGGGEVVHRSKLDVRQQNDRSAVTGSVALAPTTTATSIEPLGTIDQAIDQIGTRRHHPR